MSTENKIDMEIFKVVKNAISQSEDIEDMGNVLVQLLTGTLDIKGCTLFIADPRKKELEILTTFGLSMEYIDKGNISSEKSITAIYSQTPIVINDTSNTDLLQYPEAAQKEGIKAIVSLPVVFSGKIIGAIRLYSGEPWEISEQDLETLMLFADHVGMAMMYTRLLNVYTTIRDTVMDVNEVWGTDWT
ncbi:MAG: GAF domain-containing protein [Desulfobacteraceae bacterium]|nr:GAF domain-containing protein [Desulfobacteraceae bacterium]